MRIRILHILFVSLVLMFGEGMADQGEKKGKIAGASYVNLRSGPDNSYPPIKILRFGEEVDVEKLEGSWYRVSLPEGERGYVYKEFIYLPSRQEIEFAKKAPTTSPVKQAAKESATEQLTETAQEEIASKQEIEVAKKNSVAERVTEGAEKQPFAQEKQVPKDVNLAETNGGKDKDTSKVSPRKLEISTAKSLEKENSTTTAPLSANPKGGRLREIALWFTAALCIFILGWIFGGNYYLRRERIERSKLHF